MSRSRAKDWLLGAAATLMLLALAAGIAWWAVSAPAGGRERASESSPTASAGPSAGVEPPAALGPDELWVADLTLDAGTVVAPEATLTDVRAVAAGVRTGPDGLLAARATVEATVPFDVVAAELGTGTEVRVGDKGQAVVVRTVEALGRELRVVATGTVDVEAGRIVVVPTSIDIGGPDLLSSVIAAVVRHLVTIEHEVEGLPEGLVLHDVTVHDDGFRAHLTGEDVRLVP